VIVDFHVYLHDILRWFEEKIENSFKPEVEDKLLKGAWALKINRGPDMLPRHSYRIVVVADSRFSDTGNYWRDRFMRESIIVKTHCNLSMCSFDYSLSLNLYKAFYVFSEVLIHLLMFAK
jgi:hypothetical protein